MLELLTKQKPCSLRLLYNDAFLHRSIFSVTTIDDIIISSIPCSEKLRCQLR